MAMLISPQSPISDCCSSLACVSSSMAPPPHAVSASAVIADSARRRVPLHWLILIPTSGCGAWWCVGTGSAALLPPGPGPGQREPGLARLRLVVGGGTGDAVDHDPEQHDREPGRGAPAPLLGAAEAEHDVVAER